MPPFDQTIRQSPEFQSALVRLVVWVAMVALIGLGGRSGHFPVDWQAFLVLFGLHLAWFLLILLSVLRRPHLLPWRTYVALASDISGTTCTIYLTSDPLGPFFLLYVLSFVSQGTRYGAANLRVASLGSVFAFLVMSAWMGAWSHNKLEVLFIVGALVLIPLYQHSLLRKLQLSRDVADQANRARGTFLTSMTRALQSPLNEMQSRLDQIRRTVLSREQKGLVEEVREAGDRLDVLVANILDLSRVDAGTFELEQRRFDLSRALVELCRARSGDALDKGLELVCNCAPDLPRYLVGDEVRLSQAILSLLSNALDSTDHGHVQLRASVHREGLRRVRVLSIEVSDTGPGIAPGVMSELLEHFEHSDASGGRRFGGAGLGTSLARDLVHMMGGRISVENRAVGGAGFRIDLPMEVDEPEGAFAPPATLAGRQVCVYESDEASALALCEACEAAGMHCTVLKDAADIVEASAADATAVDLLIVADSPRGLDLEGLSRLLRRQLRSDVPVVYLHYTRRPVSILERVSAGVLKPFDAAELYVAMDGALHGGARESSV